MGYPIKGTVVTKSEPSKAEYDAAVKRWNEFPIKATVWYRHR